ncbi:hypothetical protein KKC08_02105 [Patescibacteria group bacterium]|nr:hypothetical protein [Patescibacteria group bacterium]MBU4265447.1 hypothetical protein [Patescibacteria group bacterium]MBU4390497.1 hypothetical protein [Patescibacteria group bacterium]MBU4396933.1 hypothetical protein [Patescibacteria group bacterium]MBU4430555.1 hypothetical protein [Patescibacteria group bacterium]
MIIGDWRLQQQRYRLAGEVCEDCGIKIFPPRDVCPQCRGTNTGAESLREMLIRPENVKVRTGK